MLMKPVKMTNAVIKDKASSSSLSCRLILPVGRSPFRPSLVCLFCGRCLRKGKHVTYQVECLAHKFVIPWLLPYFCASSNPNQDPPGCC